MATPMTASEFLDLLKKWSIPYLAMPGWSTHNRNHKGPWGEVYGVMLHHTGDDDQIHMPNILWDGYGDLPGPLCHGGIDANGIVLLTGWGRCNHAGLGDGDVLDKVVTEKYTGVLKPDEAFSDGNRAFYGFEIMYDGTHIMTPPQQETAFKVSAAICSHHNWTEKSVIGHGEWQPGKWDPGYKPGVMMDMSIARSLIGKVIEKGPVVTVPPKPTPPAVTPYEVKAGDTPWAIAARFLGNGNRWPEIVKLNPNIVVLVPGDKLKLPEK